MFLKHQSFIWQNLWKTKQLKNCMPLTTHKQTPVDYYFSFVFYALFICLKLLNDYDLFNLWSHTSFCGTRCFFNNLATVSVRAVWCVLEGQTHAACTLPVQQLCKHAPHGGGLGLRTLIGPVRLESLHWASQEEFGVLMPLSGGGICGKQLTTHFASSALLLFFLSFPLLGSCSMFSV